MPSAASDGLEAEALGELADDPPGRVGVERHLAAEEALGVEAAEHDVRVGDRRLVAAAAVAGRAGHGAGAAGPTRKAPASSIQAIEPPPAPIVWMSNIGTSTGWPAIRSCRAPTPR